MTTRQQSDDEIRETLIARAVKARLNGSEVVCDLDALVRAAGRPRRRAHPLPRLPGRGPAHPPVGLVELLELRDGL